MPDNKTFTLLAVLHEINNREFKNKLAAFPEDLHYFATLACSIIGAENSKRISETPEGVSKNSEEFVSNLLDMTNVGAEEKFRGVLETYLLDALKDELKSCCYNCLAFNKCLDIENLSVGDLFKRRVHGEETPQIREEISRQVSEAFMKTPYLCSDDAHLKCGDFSHQYNASSIGEVFGRYSDIAAGLHKQFGINYQHILQQMIGINMDFVKSQVRPSRQAT